MKFEFSEINHRRNSSKFLLLSSLQKVKLCFNSEVTTARRWERPKLFLFRKFVVYSRVCCTTCFLDNSDSGASRSNLSMWSFEVHSSTFKVVGCHLILKFQTAQTCAFQRCHTNNFELNLLAALPKQLSSGLLYIYAYFSTTNEIWI